ncbi:MaoC family dehydratase [Shimia sp. SK013]|uniref:MaoC family dehydratase n=1 Tax=Shimia sp. SK013 TaxID=1389006 RepID=UPI0006B4BC61|nr:MaoC family dehydratase [Shimia sp. SK013]
MAETPVFVSLGVMPDLSEGAVQSLSKLVSDLLDGRSAQISLTTAAMMLGAPDLKAVRDAMMPPVGKSVVHETQRFWRAADAPTSGSLEVSLAQSASEEAARFTFRLAIGGEVSGEMETRLRFVSADQMSMFKGAKFSERMASDKAISESTLPLSPSAVGDYVALAHDANPIHVDARAAKAAGLSGPVVPGMLLCALSEAAYRNAAGGQEALELKTRFMAAVPVGEPVRFILVPRGVGRAWQQARVFCVTENDMIAAISDIRGDV